MGLYVIGSFFSFWTDPQNLIAFSKAALGLGLVIFVHELGHFLVAKACGVKCEKFYVGFDVPIKLGPITLPASLFKKQVGETEYGIGIVPLGGYVKMLGQDDNPGSASEEQERIRIKTTNAAGEDEYELDPRSYPAKTVPQRMAIISAGVIMNLIFGVVFATVAYRYGVKYLPCVVGSTMPGDPAWTAGMMPGDKIVQLGKEGEPNDELRFTRELRFGVIEAGEGNLLPVKVRREDDSEAWLDVTPSTLFKKQSGLPMIGIGAGSSNIVLKVPADEFSIAAKSELKEGDRIVKAVVGGSEIPIDSMLDMNELLLAHDDQPIEFEVARPDDPQADPPGESSKLTVTLAPQPVRLLGMWMEMSPVAGVQAGSPADLGGVRAGDVLVAIDGDPIADPMFIDDTLATKIGDEVVLTVKREGEETQLSVTPRARPQLGWPQRMGGAVSVESLGLAFALADTVANVPAGGPAEAAGLQTGDQLVSLTTAAPNDAKFSPLQKQWFRIDEEAKFLPDAAGFAASFGALQEKPAGLEVHVTYRRGDELKSAVIEPQVSSDQFYFDRGIILKPLSGTRTAGSWSEAVRLGVDETKNGISQVFFTLKKFKDVYRNLAGPVAIGAIATSEASEGIPRLLIFLTLLSANLAVLNFLPIPVLDGGHMMFLLYEGIFGKPVNERIAFGLTMLGLSMILALMVFVIGLDFYRFTFG